MIAPLSALDGLSAGAAPAPVGAASASVSGASFADVLSQVSTDAMSVMRGAEAAAVSGIGGGSPVQEVVQAVMSAEQTLNAAIAIRDKVVAAYQEISRMAI